MTTSNVNQEELESRTDAFRREYAAVGGDWAYFLVQFLQGRRRTEIKPDEIVKTQTYLRANDAERRALEFVCAVDHPSLPTPDDEIKLRLRDQFLVDFADGLTLGHADLVAEIRSIPMRVAERQKSDRALFATVYPQPFLFSWVGFGEVRRYGD